MQAAARNRKASSPELPENALTQKVLAEIEKIEAEARQRKLAQLETLQQARGNILERIGELQHQLAHIDKAIAAADGKPGAIRGDKPLRRNLNDVRERVGRWLQERKGQKFGAGDLVKEFPELEGTPISYLLKPLVQSGQVQVDASEGIKRPKYFAAAE